MKIDANLEGENPELSLAGPNGEIKFTKVGMSGKVEKENLNISVSFNWADMVRAAQSVSEKVHARYEDESDEV